ncbi:MULTISPECIES: hypothetical protein [Sphingomonas]|uniref:Uncharacterized protein n=1 Tax=Sphingomonas parapaucimobilis NBRC 15100 TaxID=1219049 RepID=A0A0A1WAI1_9SPHN|nr:MULTISPECIES: hypothetical protein [Sphingomonas]OMJ31940.1 hypothetical protein BSZ14_10840 [Sphingomonas sp. Sph1(2015)]GAM01944.1 hypothetical protein SP5_070_00270 [Sphingomonas parapaucimobilis NBRC 15100]
MARKPVRGYRRACDPPARFRFMIGLSVAVGRFVEALFWAILRVAGMVGGVVLLVGVVLGVMWWLIRRRR